MIDLNQLLSDPSTVVAVVGATDNPAKYGSVAYRDLKRKGFQVYAVNPNRSTVDGDTAYPDLASLPTEPTILNFVVPPGVTLKTLEEAKKLGFTTVWLQPGSESPEVLAYLQREGFDYLANACIMVQSRMLQRR